MPLNAEREKEQPLKRCFPVSSEMGLWDDGEPPQGGQSQTEPGHLNRGPLHCFSRWALPALCVGLVIGKWLYFVVSPYFVFQKQVLKIVFPFSPLCSNIHSLNDCVYLREQDRGGPDSHCFLSSIYSKVDINTPHFGQFSIREIN